MLFDAHNHLQDPRLDAWRPDWQTDYAAAGVAGAVVNGTREEDWLKVKELCSGQPVLRPAYGLHPWHVASRSQNWAGRLEDLLQADPAASLGEMGLDRWINNPDVAAQVECFRTQRALARKLQRPQTIHCLRAFGLLDEELRRESQAAPPFLLHSYSGPAEMVPGFVKLGAYFSLSPYFGHARKSAQLAVFQQIPKERLLVETDAPDMRPPDDENPHPLSLGAEQLNHPANIQYGYRLLARTLQMPLEEVMELAAQNFMRLFGAAPEK